MQIIYTENNSCMCEEKKMQCLLQLMLLSLLSPPNRNSQLIGIGLVMSCYALVLCDSQ